MGVGQVKGVHCRVVGRACDGRQDADDALGPTSEWPTVPPSVTAVI